MIGNIFISCLWPNSMCCNFISLLLMKKSNLLSLHQAALARKCFCQVLNEVRAGVPHICLRGEAGSHTRDASDFNGVLSISLKEGCVVVTAPTLSNHCWGTAQSVRKRVLEWSALLHRGRGGIFMAFSGLLFVSAVKAHIKISVTHPAAFQIFLWRMKRVQEGTSHQDIPVSTPAWYCMN